MHVSRIHKSFGRRNFWLFVKVCGASTDLFHKPFVALLKE